MPRAVVLLIALAACEGRALGPAFDATPDGVAASDAPVVPSRDAALDARPDAVRVSDGTPTPLPETGPDAIPDIAVADARAACGDAVCQPALGENCRTCSSDCGDCPFCGDRTCGRREDCASCPEDCCPGCCDCFNCCCDCFCQRDVGETCQTCESDCGVCHCGNGTCDPAESCSTCAIDCGPC